MIPQADGILGCTQSGMGVLVKITDAKVMVCSPGRNFVTLKVSADQGIYGLGDATLNGRELAVVSYLQDHLIPCLIGRDPFQTEDIWQYFYRGAYWRRGPVTMTAIAAIDMALWDIKGKAFNTPVYNLLGGRSRDGVLVYGHANGRDIEETSEEVGKYISLGYRAVRAQTGVPGLPSTYGVAKDKMFYEPAEKGLPPENSWSTESIFYTFRSCLNRFASNLATRCICCTTCITG
jgi:mannonate dehydratase